MRVLAHSGAALLALGMAPVGLAGLALRPRWRVGWRERLGRTPALAPGAVWIHGASVGEALASLALHDAFAARGLPTLASTMTLTGREALGARRPDLPRLFAPLDHPWCAGAALARVRPRALVLFETELWPAWIAAAVRAGVPVVVVSGRISDRSLPRYRRFAFVLAPTLRRLSAVGARSAADADRFVALGVSRERVEVTGDLKLEPPARPPALAPELGAVLGATPLFVAGSTHAGEEQAALAALDACERAGHAVSLLLAPRHPERADEVEALALARGRRVRRRSRLGAGPLRSGEVLLLDSVGELGALYGRASVVFVGGSLVPRGGHNVLEPVLVGRAVLFGPHTANARDAAALLLGCDAGRVVADAQALAREVVRGLDAPEQVCTRGARGRALLEAHRGAADRSVALVERAIASRSA